MKESRAPDQGPPKRRTLARWIAYPLGIFVWEVLPWIISLLGPRYGWTEGRPGPWNLLGLIPVLVGTAGFIWGMKMHSAVSPPEGIDMEPDKDYFLRRGPYAFSRNPMYLFELILLLGWVVFYGSPAIAIAWLAWWGLFNFYQIPQEERVMEAHFGEPYRDYRRHVRRWFGHVAS
jgi:protein-S-isoprenylcysteine O-methyltransferase Ste14